MSFTTVKCEDVTLFEPFKILEEVNNVSNYCSTEATCFSTKSSYCISNFDFSAQGSVSTKKKINK